LILLLVPQFLLGVEKYWVAHEAELIVVGHFHPGLRFPWFTGYYLSGTISIEEVLYGHVTASPVRYQTFIPCGFPMQCDYRGLVTFKVTDFMTGKWVWLLKHRGGDAWEPSVGLGMWRLSERADLENYIRLYKK
jgi:hypothetical protein